MPQSTASGISKMGLKLVALGMIAYGCFLLWGAKRDFTSRVAEGSDGLGQPFKRSRDERPISYWLTICWYCVFGPALIVGGIYAFIAL